MPESVQQRYKRIAKETTDKMEKLAEKMDLLYKKYRERIQKPVKLLPSKREGFDICSPKFVRKTLKYIPEDDKEREAYISDMLNTCSLCLLYGIESQFQMEE